MATYEVKGIFSICLILCVLEGSYFLLFWYNKQIIFTWNEIIYRSIFGIEKKYSWEDVKTVCYKSIGRGANRILIQTDKKIYIAMLISNRGSDKAQHRNSHGLTL